jgi:hypothetical protein
VSVTTRVDLRVYCPSAKCTSAALTRYVRSDDRVVVRCPNPSCEFAGFEWDAPTIELVAAPRVGEPPKQTPLSTADVGGLKNPFVVELILAGRTVLADYSDELERVKNPAMVKLFAALVPFASWEP